MRKFYAIAIFFLMLTIFAPIIIFILRNPFSNDSSPTIEIRIGIIAVIISITIFFIDRLHDSYKTTKEDTERKKNSCNAILKEVDVQRYRLISNRENRHNRTPDIQHIDRLLDTAAYDSIVNSGLFTDFKTDTQQYLSNLYGKIKCRNDLLIYVNNFIDISVSYKYYPGKEDIIGERATFYETILNNWEGEIIRLLNVVEDLIKEELL